MKLKAPYSGVTVTANGELAHRLMERGFSPAAKPKEAEPEAKPRARKTRKKD